MYIMAEDVGARNGETTQQSRLILDFRYRNVPDHSTITMLDLAADCGLDATLPIIVEEVVDDDWITETWELLDATDEASLAAAEAVYADFVREVTMLADRGFAEINFEVPDGEAGQDYFAPQPPSVQ
jgi:hypothetical protein